MQWTLRLGTGRGVAIKVHATLLFLLAFLGFTNWMSSQSPLDVVGSLAAVVALFACILVHEFGHVMAAQRYGINTEDVVLLPIGGVARLERNPETRGQARVRG